jgi:hypothetical protein
MMFGKRWDDQLVQIVVEHQLEATYGASIHDAALEMLLKRALADFGLARRTAPRHRRAVYGSDEILGKIQLRPGLSFPPSALPYRIAG